MELPEYKWRGARALVILQDKYLRQFIETWKEAKLKQVAMPVTDDHDYASMETLLRHVLRASRGYMTWMCQKLELPDPGIDKTPEAVEMYNRVISKRAVIAALHLTC